MSPRLRHGAARGGHRTALIVGVAALMFGCAGLDLEELGAGEYVDPVTGFAITVPGEGWVGGRIEPAPPVDDSVSPRFWMAPRANPDCTVQVGYTLQSPDGEVMVATLRGLGLRRSGSAVGNLWEDEHTRVTFLPGPAPTFFTWSEARSPECDVLTMRRVEASLRRARSEEAASAWPPASAATPEDASAPPGFFTGLVHGVLLVPRILVCWLMGWPIVRMDGGVGYWIGLVVGLSWVFKGGSGAGRQ